MQQVMPIPHVPESAPSRTGAKKMSISELMDKMPSLVELEKEVKLFYFCSVFFFGGLKWLFFFDFVLLRLVVFSFLVFFPKQKDLPRWVTGQRRPRIPLDSIPLQSVALGPEAGTGGPAAVPNEARKRVTGRCPAPSGWGVERFL